MVFHFRPQLQHDPEKFFEGEGISTDLGRELIKLGHLPAQVVLKLLMSKRSALLQIIMATGGVRSSDIMVILMAKMGAIQTKPL